MTEQRDALARVLYEEGAYCGDCQYAGWSSCKDCREVTTGYAAAVIASSWLDKHERGTTAMTLDMAAEQIAVKWGRFNTTANRIADDLHQYASSIREGVE